MSTRLDLVLKKHPDHESGIRLLAARDPSGNLKYLDWGARMLSLKQALAPEIADTLDLFHRFNGQWCGTGRHRDQIRTDLYSYRPQDLAGLRDKLIKLKRAADRKQKKRERLYRIEGSMEFDVVYDSEDLIVRHIKNKQACVHHGLNTQWCISMLQEGYFEDYEAHNSVFFFFERKTRTGDEYDKMALMVARVGQRVESAEAFTALDRRVDMMSLTKIHGARTFEIFREIYSRSEQYPVSVMSQIYCGKATQDQLELTLANISKNELPPYETKVLLQAICCNDEASQGLLEDVLRTGPSLMLAAWKRGSGRSRAQRIHRGRRPDTKDLMRVLTAAVSIHPNVSDELRERLFQDLRRRHVLVDTVRRDDRNGELGVSYDTRNGGKVLMGSSRRRRLRSRRSVRGLLSRARRLDRTSTSLKKRAKRLQLRQDAEKKKVSKRKAKR